MRIPAVNPTAVSGVNGNASYWTALRAACRASIYPSGLPSTMMTSSSIVSIPGKPAECARVRRYVLDNPGGRVGTSIYVDLAEPVATPVGRLLVFYTGHIQTVYWWNIYCANDGTSVIQRMLARGWYVLICGLPCYDVNPQPQHVTIGGSLIDVVNNHPYSAGFSDGGASPNRLFTDHAIQGLTSVFADYGTMPCALAGHSGGGAAGCILASIDDRYVATRISQGGGFGVIGGAIDVCHWSGNPIYTVACGGNAKDAVTDGNGYPALSLIGAAVAGRHTMVDHGPSDEYFGDAVHPGATAAFQALAERGNVWMRSSFGSSYGVWLKTGLAADGYYHNHDAIQAAETERWLVEVM